MSSLEMRNVSFAYQEDGSLVLKDISCRLETGKFVALLGANGSGKSTLGKIAAGLLIPSRGTVNQSPEYAPDSWNRIGMLFQNPDDQLFTNTVESELVWGLENLGLENPEISRRVKEAVDLFKLGELVSRSPESLSDGWKQMLALASIVAMQPDFLILDEANAFLDRPSRKMILEISESLSQKIGIMWIGSNADEAINSDTIILLKDGVIVASGSPEDVIKPEILEHAGIEPLS